MCYDNDEYTLDIESLGDKKQIEVIRTLILEATTPFSLGISGRWGSGKTSVMKHLFASLGGKPSKHSLSFGDVSIEKEDSFTKIYDKYEEIKKIENIKNIHTIWFNPWENENHQEPMVGLLQEIHNHFSFIQKNLAKGRKIASVSIQAGLDILSSFKKMGKNQGTNIVNIGKQYEYDNFISIERNQKFKFAFQESVKLLLFKNQAKNLDKNARLIIFIDDLDRCEDSTVATLLKEIKQYLSTKYCIFIFGYDRQHIEKALSNTEVYNTKDARVYLEKLFQATFYLREPSNEQIKEYIKTKCETKDEAVYSFILSIIDPNPRRIKNFLTGFYLHTEIKEIEINDTKESKDDLKKIALITYLKLFYEPVYSALENNPEVFLPIICNVCESANRNSVKNKEEYFVYLEFLSHFDDVQSAVEMQDKIEEITKNDTNVEEKFLKEVYLMQGRHRNFLEFKKQFNEYFKEKENIERYL
jgi:hypothetical protein